MKLRVDPTVLRRVRAAAETSVTVDAAPRTPARDAPATPLGAPATPLTLDPKKAPVPFARIEEVLSRTAAQAHLAVLDDKTLHKAKAGALTFAELYRVIARGTFGAVAKQPITYASFKRALDGRGLAHEWRALLAALPRPLLEKHMAGKLSPLELFAAYAEDRASWRNTVHPVSLEQVTQELAREGRLDELVRARRVMTPAQETKLEMGLLTPPQIEEILVDAGTRQPDVVIVGAGMAGLAAAQELSAKGLSVVVLEAGDVIGGRTRDATVGGQRFDAGAAWIHATDENPLTPIVKQRGFTMVAHDAALMGFGAKGAPLEEGKRVGDAIAHAQEDLEHAAQHGVDVPASQVFTPSSAPTWDVHARNTVGPLTMGVDVDRTSTLDAGSAPAEEHGDLGHKTPDQFIEEGWASVVQSFAHGVPVRLRTAVTSVTRAGDGVVVEAGGVKFSAKALVMTASTGVLASKKIAWHPPLPEWKREAIEKTPMATFDKIAVRFDKDVFTHRDDGKSTAPGAFVYEASDANPIDVLVRPMNKDVVVALVGGAYADELRKRGEAYAVEQLMQKLERIYGKDVREHAIASAVTSWKDDPWTIGSFTASLPGYQHMREKLRRPVGDTVFFAGEALSDRWNGMVPGAYLTGLDAAHDARAAIAKKKLKTRRSSEPRPTV